jgi:hypothetical protein
MSPRVKFITAIICIVVTLAAVVSYFGLRSASQDTSQSAREVLTDAMDGRIDGHWSRDALRAAIDRLPVMVYSRTVAAARHAQQATCPPQVIVSQVRALIAHAGDRYPATARFVLTRRQATNEVLSGASVNSNQPVYVVVVEGSFAVPRPGPVASGLMQVAVLDFVFDALRGRMTDGGPVVCVRG